MDFVLISFFAQVVVFYSLIVGFEFLRTRGILSLIGLNPSKPSIVQEVWRKAS